MSVTIEREPFTNELLAEILPLAQKCWKESTVIKGESCAFYGERDFEIVPFVEIYHELAAKESLVLIALRADGKLNGYVEGFTYRSLHHKKIIGAIGDSIYIEQLYRPYAAVLVDRFENELKKLGVNIIGWPTQLDGPIYEVLKAKGYVGDDIVMEKRLCV